MRKSKNDGAALAPKNEVSPVERFEKKVADFQEGYANEMAGFAVQARDLVTGKREYLYSAIQEAYCIGSELRLPENKAVLDKLLADHGLPTEVRQGTNPWMPVTNLLFGKWVTSETGARFFEVDKSAKKYAVSFRYFEEHQWEPELVADQLRDPHTGKLNSFGKLDGKVQRGLVGTENWGRYEHREDDPDERTTEVGRDVLWSKGKPIVTIKGHLNSQPHDAGQYVALWGVQTGADELSVYGEMVGGSYSRGVEAYLRKAAKEVDTFGTNIAKGKEVGKGNRPPKSVAWNIVAPMLESMVRQLEEAAADLHDMAGEAVTNSNNVNDKAAVERLLAVSRKCREQQAEIKKEIDRLLSYLQRAIPIELDISTPLGVPEKPRIAPAKPSKPSRRRGVKVGDEIKVHKEGVAA